MFKQFQDIIRDLFDAIAAAGSQITDFNIGSVARTILEAVAAVMEEIWYYLEQFVNRFFISTSEGDWLDKRVNDFGLYRKMGTMATGTITVMRSTPSPMGIAIPAGTLFITDAGVGIVTTADATLPVGQTDVDIPAQAQAVGSAGNLPPGTVLKQAGVAITGLESVQVKQMSGGIDTETDDELKARVPGYFASLGRATSEAISFAAMSVQGVKSVTIQENTPQDGWFTVYVDDGSGTATQALINAVAAAVEAYRGFGVHYSVIAPDRQWLSVAATVTVKSGYVAAQVLQQAHDAIVGYVNSLGMGQSALLAALYKVIMEVPGVANVVITAPAGDVTVPANSILRTSDDRVVIT